MKKVQLFIVGAGNRGFAYAEYARMHPEQAVITGVAEPRDYYRNKMAAEHNIPPEHVFKDWREAVDKEKFADAVIIATQDTQHTDPAVTFSEKGYHMLLEKPMSTRPEECRKITSTVLKNNTIFAVCHVLRYTNYTQRLKEIIASGAIGRIVSMQHLEPVGYWHHAHSFVRGNWRKENEASFMLLAKSCHDIDWIQYIMDSRCTAVSSFGSLMHFRQENKPAKAADRCTECGCEPECPYSAKKIYLSRAQEGNFEWPLDTITSDLTVAGIEKAIETGPYGRCVYACDNDVVDHQVVDMRFENETTVTFTMTAFTEMCDRRTRIFGTKGELYGDGKSIEYYDFLTNQRHKENVSALDGDISSGHGGGDYNLMKNFVTAVAQNDRSRILSGPTETLESHTLIFAAEKARIENCVVSIPCLDVPDLL
ncbi:MAG: Gfo/Idh/MocA family oxidoreductase [Planctomycetota bacterium]